MAETGNWSNIAESGFLSGMRFLFWVYQHIGAWAFTLLSYPVVLYYFLSKGVARKSSMEFLSLARKMGAKGLQDEPSWRDVYRHIQEFAHSTIDKLGVWANTDKFDNVSFPNRTLLLDQLDRGEGAVLLGAHLGNLEVCRGLSRLNPRLKLNILVHTRNADMFNKLLQEMHFHRELELIEVSELTPATAIRLTECVERGEFVAIMADRVPVASQGRTQSIEFLGEKAEFPEGPYILAFLLKCPVFTLFCTRSKQGYEIRCQKFSSQIMLPRHGRGNAMVKYMKMYAKILEKETIQTPFQWFNFYPFWGHSE